MRNVLLCVSTVLALVSNAGLAQNYPSQPIKILVPYAAGGADLQIRALQPMLTKELGGVIIVENQAGAGGQLAASAVATAPANGYTLLFSGGGPVLILPMIRKLSYSLDSFAPIANITATPLLVVTKANVPYTTIKDLLSYAKQNPGAINYASSGVGTTPHIVVESLQTAADIKMTHVPFQGIGPAIAAMLGGTIDVYVGIPGSLLAPVKEGKLQVLASTGTSRSEFAPQVPMLREVGLDVVEATRFALFAPKQTPEPILQKLSAAVRAAVNAPEYVENMHKMYTTVAYMPPAETASAFTQDATVYKRILTRTGLIGQ